MNQKYKQSLISLIIYNKNNHFSLTYETNNYICIKNYNQT